MKRKILTLSLLLLSPIYVLAKPTAESTIVEMPGFSILLKEDAVKNLDKNQKFLDDTGFDPSLINEMIGTPKSEKEKKGEVSSAKGYNSESDNKMELIDFIAEDPKDPDKLEDHFEEIQTCTLENRTKVNQTLSCSSFTRSYETSTTTTRTDSNSFDMGVQQSFSVKVGIFKEDTTLSTSYTHTHESSRAQTSTTTTEFTSSPQTIIVPPNTGAKVQVHYKTMSGSGKYKVTMRVIDPIITNLVAWHGSNCDSDGNKCATAFSKSKEIPLIWFMDLAGVPLTNVSAVDREKNALIYEYTGDIVTDLGSDMNVRVVSYDLNLEQDQNLSKKAPEITSVRTLETLNPSNVTTESTK